MYTVHTVQITADFTVNRKKIYRSQHTFLCTIQTLLITKEFTVNCILYTQYRSQYTLLYTVHTVTADFSVYCTPCTYQCIPYCILYTLYRSQETLLYAVYTLQITADFTVNSTKCKSYSKHCTDHNSFIVYCTQYKESLLPSVLDNSLHTSPELQCSWDDKKRRRRKRGRKGQALTIWIFACSVSGLV